MNKGNLEKIAEDVLLKKTLATNEQILKARENQTKYAGGFREALVELGIINKKALILVLSEELHVSYIESLEKDMLDKKILSNLPISFLRENKLIPLKKVNNTIQVAMADPTDIHPLDDLRLILGCDVQPVLAEEEQIERLINTVHESKAETADEIIEDMAMTGREGGASIVRAPEDLLDIGDKAPVIKLINLIFFQAVKERASDIHIEPYEKGVKVRFRIDGVLYDRLTPPKEYQAEIVSRIKIMAKLNIAEKRLPQDGRIKIRISDKEMDIRVSTIPIIFGERVVMRLLDKTAGLFSLTDLGFSKEVLAKFEKTIAKTNGIILVTGPTGSGKTTTLYGALSKINLGEKNIITIEDPVEYQLEGIGQMQVMSKIELTFANGLRSILRQDPDVIMIGEIRDKETAEIAVQASLTGHLVFSTLHTNDSASAITRLIDMKVEPYLISSTVIAVLAQRLVRKICPDCKEKYKPTSEELKHIGINEKDLKDGYLYKEKGCKECLDTGFRGRVGIYEMLIIDRDLKDMIVMKKQAVSIKDHAVKLGMKTLYTDGVRKVIDGVTTIEEVLRITQNEMVDA